LPSSPSPSFCGAPSVGVGTVWEGGQYRSIYGVRCSASGGEWPGGLYGLAQFVVVRSCDSNHAPMLPFIRTSPRFTATPIASVRPATFGFFRMCVTWTLTVHSEMSKCYSEFLVTLARRDCAKHVGFPGARSSSVIRLAGARQIGREDFLARRPALFIAVIGTLNSRLEGVQTPTAATVPSHLSTRSLRFPCV
jgi:hypothetical protein